MQRAPRVVARVLHRQKAVQQSRQLRGLVVVQHVARVVDLSHFETAYKLQVAKMLREQGMSPSQVCKDMNLTPSAVRKWVKQLDAELAGGPGVGKPLTADQQRIRELEHQVRQLKSDKAKANKPSTSISPLSRAFGVSRSGLHSALTRQTKPPEACG
ncbi:hypothetical protein GCM10028785_31080 [Hydrogenophaga soli]